MKVEPGTADEVKIEAAKAEPVKQEHQESATTPGDEEIKAALAELLAEADLQTTTERSLRKALEKKFGCDMQARKALIRAEVEQWLEANQSDQEGAEAEDDEAQPAAEPSTSKRKKGAFHAGCSLSPELAAFLGVETMSRPDVVKNIWAYIKANNLQNPKDKRKIMLDDKLMTFFKPPVTMFSMNKQLTKHVKTQSPGRRKPADDDDEEEEDDDDAEDDDDDDEEEEEDAAPAKKKAKPATAKSAKPAKADKPAKASASGKASSSGKVNGFSKPIGLSDELSEFLGGGVKSMGRPELTKRFWAYFKEKDLLDPQNKQFVRCDAALKKLFKVDKFRAFGFQTHLKRHLSKE